MINNPDEGRMSFIALIIRVPATLVLSGSFNRRTEHIFHKICIQISWKISYIAEQTA